MSPINRHQERRILEAGRAVMDLDQVSSDAGFDFRRLGKDSRAFQTAAGRLALLVVSRDPRLEETQAIVSVANTATDLGELVADTLGLPHIRTQHYKEGGLYLPDPISNGVESVVIVDDVFRKGQASSEVAWALNEVGILVQNVSVVIDQSGRSRPTINQGGVTVPVNSLIRQSIPRHEGSV
jgi:adenine/guanine phosphoribosyltransferase-like PRPP-binding protein